MGTEIFGPIVLVIVIEVIALLSTKLTKKASTAIGITFVITIAVVIILNLTSGAGNPFLSILQLLSVSAIVLLLSTPTVLYILKKSE